MWNKEQSGCLPGSWCWRPTGAVRSSWSLESGRRKCERGERSFVLTLLSLRSFNAHHREILKVYSVKPSFLGERAVMFLHSIVNDYGLCVLSDQSFLDLDPLRFQQSHTCADSVSRLPCQWSRATARPPPPPSQFVKRDIIRLTNE